MAEPGRIEFVDVSGNVWVWHESAPGELNLKESELWVRYLSEDDIEGDYVELGIAP